MSAYISFRSLRTFALAAALIALFAQTIAFAELVPSPLVSRSNPAWVSTGEFDPNDVPKRANESGNEFFLLIDKQYDLASKTSYYRYFKRLNNSGGLQDGSQLEVSYDPAFQKLQFHSLVIHRKGKPIDRLEKQEFKVIQREKDHERQLYDSSLSAIAVIEGTRVHDVIEYSFSIQGSNPAFAPEDFHWIVTTGYTIPVGKINARLRVPPDTNPFIKSHVVDYKPVITRDTDFVSYEWKIENPKIVLSEGDLPGDFDPWGWIEATNCESWSEVADWALAHYQIPETLPPELMDEIESIRAIKGEENQVLAALRFVQDEIRYLGIFEGVHSHKPYAIETILKRRFGDCKDKSLMLTAMLRELGFDATPALVETEYRGAIATWLPTPNAFDHLVVSLNFKERTYWLDATSSYERGPLGERFFPNYGNALLIKKGVTDLTTLGEQGFEFAKTIVREHFEIEDYSGPTKLKVTTTYSGREADSTRSYFASTPRAKVEHRYLNYYSELYDSITSDKKIVLKDNEKSNTITVEESYLIEDIWDPSENGETLNAVFSSQYTFDEILLPSSKNRKMPYSIPHPNDVFHETKISLPDGMDAEDESISIEDPSFAFDYSERYLGKTTLVQFHYRSLSDRILPKDTASYLENAKKAENQTSYSMWISRGLYEGTEEASFGNFNFQFNWAIFALILVSIIGSTLACVLLLRWKPAPRVTNPPFDSSLVGLGGWLVLPAIGVIIRPILYLIVVGSLIYNYNLETWNELTSPGSESYHPLWAPMMLLECVIEASILPLCLLVLIRFFQKHSSAPGLIILLFTLETIGSLILFALVRVCTDDKDVISEYFAILIKSAFAAVIWIPYFLVSVRAASTFRNPLNMSPLPETKPPSLPVSQDSPAE